MPQDQPRSLPKRADAERNRDKILAAARAAFAEADTQVSMAEVSRRAGVGMATLYRNFPGRRELLEALYADEVNALCEAAEAAETTETAETADGQTPGAVFSAWLRRFLAFSASKRPIASELLTHLGRSDPVFSDNRARVLAAGQPLLIAAQRAREVRDDLTLEQILDMIIAIATINGEAQYREPILRAALDGLRPSSDAQEPPP